MTSRSIVKSAVWFALVGPPIGAAIAFCLLLASVALHKTFGRDEDISLMETALVLLVDAAIILAAAYPIGGPAAFSAGAMMGIASKRGVGKVSIVASSILIGAVISMLTVYGLDEYVLPHPHLEAAPLLGANIWLSVGCVGAVSAAICSYISLRRT